MKRLIPAACAALLVIAAAPAGADDLLFGRGAATGLTEANIGQPWWKLNAQCAGMFAAAYNYNSSRGNSEEAARNKAIGGTMLNAAIDRLVRDRRMERKTAVDLTLLQVSFGRETAADMLTAGDGPRSPWNTQRSVCLDIHDAYTGKYG